MMRLELGPALADYLSMRRALGYKLQRTEKLLADFIPLRRGRRR